jgi:hypothetical protein
MNDQCPICGEKKVSFDKEGFHSHHDYEHLEPDEEWCDFCGFQYMETGDINAYDKSIEYTLEGIESRIDNIDDIIADEIDFRDNKMPRLKKINFDKWREKFGWVKNEDGFYTRSGDYWKNKELKETH